jgi:SAM-dependent methyltransferase
MSHWTDELFRTQADRFAGWMAGRFEAAEDDVGELLALLESEHDLEPDSVLDVACGIGRHVVAFGGAGLRAEGLDFSEEFLERARERADEADLADRTGFYHADMRNLDGFEGEYDLVTVFWNSLGYYGRETDREVLAAARDLLAPGGALVVEMTNKAHFLTNFEGSTVRETGDGLTVERAEYDPATGRHHIRIEHFEADDGYEHVASTEFEPRLYAPVELRELCEAAGFETVTLHGGYGGDELTIETPTVVVVAE